MKNLKRTVLAGIALAGLTAVRSATAQVFVNVTPTATGGAQISGTQEVVSGPPPGTITDVPVALQSATITGLNQNVSTGNTSSIFTTAFDTYSTTANAMTITVGTQEGYANFFKPDTTVGCNVSLGVTFQVAAPGTYQLSGNGFIQQATSYELGTLHSDGTFVAMQGSNIVLSVRNEEGISWQNTSGGTYANTSLLDLNLTPGTVYTLNVNAFDTYANAGGDNYTMALTNPRGIGANLTITDLTPVPEPATWSLLSLGGLALQRRRRKST